MKKNRSLDPRLPGKVRSAWDQATACPDAMALASYLDQLADAGETAAIESHLRDCAECRRAVQDLRSVLSCSPASLSHEAAQRIGAFVREEVRSSRDQYEKAPTRYRGFRSASYRFAAAALLFMAIGVSVLLFWRGTGASRHSERLAQSVVPSTVSLHAVSPAAPSRLVDDEMNQDLERVIQEVSLQMALTSHLAVANDLPGAEQHCQLEERLSIADALRREGHFEEALGEYGRLDRMLAESGDILGPMECCCYASQALVTDVYVPVSEAGCYAGLGDYARAEGRLRETASRLSQANGLPGCSCDVCECLGRIVERMVSYCSVRSAAACANG